MVAHCRHDEPEIFPGDWARAGTASGGDVFADHVSRDRISVSQGILQLAMSGRNDVGVSGQVWEEIVGTNFSSDAMG